MASRTTQKTWLSLISQEIKTNKTKPGEAQVIDNDLGSNVEDGLG